MVLYEVNLAIDREIAAAYAAWLGSHIDEILMLDGFVSAEWWRVEPPEAAGAGDRVRWCVQYQLRDRAALQAYFDEHAERLRGDGLTRFAGRFEASRRVLVERSAGEESGPLV